MTYPKEQTVYLIYAPQHQVSNNQYGVSGFDSYIVKTINNVKTIENLQQTIRLPWDSSYDSTVFNVVKFANGMIYDVIDVRDSSVSSHAIEVDISFNPVSSYITTGITIAGWFERTPSLQNYGETISPTNDSFYTSRYVQLPCDTSGWAYNDKPMYVEIVSKMNLTTGTSVSSLTTYGMFCPGYDKLLSSSGAGYYAVTTDGHLFPSLRDIMNDIDTVTGLKANTIVGVSISPRCPWKYDISQYSGYNVVFRIKNVSGSYLTPVALDSGRYIYEITQSNADINPNRTTSSTLTLSEYERMCGRIVVTDERGNEITQIPNECFTSSHTLPYYAYGISDVTGLYTIFNYLDKHFIINEGQLPWVGDAWSDYMQSEYEYDRQMLQNSIAQTKQQYNLDKQTAIANGILNTTYAAGMGSVSSNPAGAGMGVAAGLVSTDITLQTLKQQKNLDISKLKATQSAKNTLVKNSVSNYFQTSYGIDYINSSMRTNGACIKVELPKNFSSTDYTNYIAYNGYPCNKYCSFTLTAGYLKGNITSTVSSAGYPAMAGPGLDLMRREIANGVRLVAL